MKDEKIIKLWNESGLNILKCTCENCSDSNICMEAYDLYNTDGDCLWIK